MSETRDREEVRAHALVQAYVDGSISPDECEELLEALRADPGLIRTVLDTMRMDRLIREVMEEETVAAAESDAASLPADVPPAGAAPRPAPRIARRIVWAAVAACVAVAAAGIWYHRTQTHPYEEVALARVRSASPDVRIIRNGRGIPAAIGAHLLPGDTMVTGRDRHAAFVYTDDGSEIGLRHITRLELGIVGESKHMYLETGIVSADVVPQSKGRPLTLTTPHAEIAVAGTRFSVNASTSSTRLDVEDGIVRMRTAAGGEWHEIGAGRWAEARANETNLVVPGRIVTEIGFKNPLPAHGFHVKRIRGVIFDGTSPWVLCGTGTRLMQVDIEEKSVPRVITMDTTLRQGIAWDGTLVWGRDEEFPHTLRGIDLRDGRVTKSLPLPEELASRIDAQGTSEIALGFGEGLFWLGCGEQIFAVDPSDGHVDRTLDLSAFLQSLRAQIRAADADRTMDVTHEARRVRALAYSGGWLYVVSDWLEVHRVSPSDGRVACSFRRPSRLVVSDVAESAGTDLWLSDPGHTRIVLVATDR